MATFAKTFDVDISSGRPSASNEAYYHGETIEFRAVRGRSVVTNIEYAAIYYQTNGMGDVWWKTDGLTFHPTNDVGAASYRFFMEGREANSSRDWHANGLLRLLDSPGFTPNEIELPVSRLDFAQLEVSNAPYYTKSETDAKIIERAPAPGNYAAVSNRAMNAVQGTDLPTFENALFPTNCNIESCSDEDGYISVRPNYIVRVDIQTGRRTEYGIGWRFGLSDAFWDDMDSWFFAPLDAATETNAQQTAQLASHASQMSWLSQSIASAARAATNYTDAAIVSAVEYIVSPETARTNRYSGVSRDAALVDGKMINYKLLTQPTATWYLNLTLADGTATGDVPVRLWGTTAATTQFSAPTVLSLVYSGGVWYHPDYNTDANNYDRNIVTYRRAAEAIKANTMVCGTTNGYQQLEAGATFDLGLPLLFCNAAQTVGKTNGNNWYSIYSGIDVRNTVAGFASRRGQPLYLLGSVDGDAFTIADGDFLSYEPVRPCIPLGFFNANADNSFCFLPGPLMAEPGAESDPVWSAEKSAYATTAALDASDRLVFAIVQGTNVMDVVTNYDSQVHIPERYLVQIDTNGARKVVWRESTMITNEIAKALAAQAADIDAALGEKADRAWSHHTSGLGADAPAGTTWISTPETHIAGGYEYEKVVTSSGAVWVLCSNGMDLNLGTGSPTNSYLQIAATDGTPIFRIEKTDSVLVGVNKSAIAPVGSTAVVSVPAVADSHPYARVCTNLVNAVWAKEDENGMPAGSPASVTWSGSSGAYVATVDFGSSPQGFCYFEFLQEGTTKIVNGGVTDLTGGIFFNGAKYVPTVSGSELKFIRQ